LKAAQPLKAEGPRETARSRKTAQRAHERILLVDDDDDFSDAVTRVLRSAGYRVTRRASLAGARKTRREEFDAVLLDVGLPDGSGTELLSEWGDAEREIPVVLLTGAPTLDSAIEAVRGRAFDYLRKPVVAEVLRTVLARALEASRLREEVARLRAELAENAASELIGSSPEMNRLRDSVEALAGSAATVLIEGESGTGKELVARALHDQSRHTGRFVAINCAALPETLLEAELFGYRRGAFTGAAVDRAGLVAEAEGGTLFLDEVGEMPASTQAKLLRLLENREYRPLGDNRARRADIRVVAATNRDLRAATRGPSPRFRDDVYWRIAVVTLTTPPLRDHREDIVELALHFAARAALRLGKPIRGIDPAVARWLATRSWPGNVRELSNAVERAVIFSNSSRLTREDFGAASTGRDETPISRRGGFSADRRAFERERLRELLAEHGGNVTKAAAAAGRNRTAFYELLRRLGIRAPRK
jgi:DNA-binding NtrC family response regulator